MSSPGDSHESEFTYRSVLLYFNQHQAHKKYLLNHMSLCPRPRGSDSVDLGSGLRTYVINKLPGLTGAVSQETTFLELILYKYQDSFPKDTTFYRGPEDVWTKQEQVSEEDFGDGEWLVKRPRSRKCIWEIEKGLLCLEHRVVLRVFRDTVEVVSSQQTLNGIVKHIKFVLHPTANGNLPKDLELRNDTIWFSLWKVNANNRVRLEAAAIMLMAESKDWSKQTWEQIYWTLRLSEWWLGKVGEKSRMIPTFMTWETR